MELVVRKWKASNERVQPLEVFSGLSLLKFIQQVVVSRSEKLNYYIVIIRDAFPILCKVLVIFELRCLDSVQTPQKSSQRAESAPHFQKIFEKISNV